MLLGKSKAIFILQSMNGFEYTDRVQFQQKKVNILSVTQFVPVRILLNVFCCKFKFFFSLKKLCICNCELSKSSIYPSEIQFIVIFCFLSLFSTFSCPILLSQIFLQLFLSCLLFQPDCLRKQRLCDCAVCPPTWKPASHNLRIG